METARAHYSGLSRKLVVALDIGTTFSGAAYAFLDPGEIPQIRPVTRYLNNPNFGSAKVPSISYYDRNGNFRGAENGVDFQDDNEFLKMQWWKLMISPTELPTAMKAQMSAQLPKGKTIIDIFADFMRYLFDSTKALLEASEPDGELRWSSVSNNVELVLTHPNGWGGPQQTQLRTAAIKAGIVSDTPAGHPRVHFVTEGEAKLNFCVTNTQAGKDLKPGTRAVIVDAGDGTIDISTYMVLSNEPLQMEELHEPRCLLQGGEFVTARARAMVQEKFRGSRFDTPGDLTAFSQRFDEGVKKVFSNDQVLQYVKFGSPRDNDPRCGITGGRLTLTGTQVSGFFEPSIRSTVDTIRDNFGQCLATNSLVFLAGSFAASPWFSGQLQKRLLDIGLKFCRPDVQTDKAVAVGAASYCVDHLLMARVSKFTYGVPNHTLYNPSNPEHVRREHKSFINPMGEKRIPGHFVTMLSQARYGTKILEDREIRHNFASTSEDTPPQYVSPEVVKYTGTLIAPQWQDVEKDKFETLCYIKVDISTAPCIPKSAATGKTYYKREYDVILLVGPTDLKAQVGWVDSETGTERRSDAVVVYDNPTERIVGNVAK